MYVKVDYDKSDGEFLTKFYERENMSDKSSTKETDPTKYVGKKGSLVRMIIEIDNIFQAKTTTLQMRARIVVFSKLKKGTESLLNEV